MSASVTPPCKGHTDPDNLILTTHPVDTLDTCASSWFLCSKQTDLSTFEDKLPTGVFATPSCKTTNVLCLSPEKTSNSAVFPMKQAVGTLANTGDFSRKAVVCVPSPTEYFVGFVIFSIKGQRVIVSGLECEIVECLKHKVPEASTVDLAVRRIGGSSKLGLYVAGHPEYCLRFYVSLGSKASLVPTHRFQFLFCVSRNHMPEMLWYGLSLPASTTIQKGHVRSDN
ncbi:hypothetical protein BDP27DRAFT_1453774 [Rhodocollybia butyracea]|uniref:Uncharacterized protein n=1 Tax=Rhodocollybia butyracea TaxID=206335 RepID=A0A9P5P8N3_9AGAR|nr:hypothetical protein BDP27DRAFT_1453774 [Rhodocollybia butyracea]